MNDNIIVRYIKTHAPGNTIVNRNLYAKESCDCYET